MFSSRPQQTNIIKFFTFSPLNRYPYNWKTPVAYLFTQFFLLLTFGSDSLLYACCIIFFYSACRFLVAFCKDLETRIKSLDNEFCQAIRTKEPNICSDRLKSGMNELVQFHWEIRELFEQSSAVYHSILALSILISGMFVGANFFELNLVCLNFIY